MEAHVSARFSIGDTSWYVEYDAGNRRFQREGLPNEPPPLPSKERSDRYNLALHDLLQNGTRNRSFAEFIVQELSGGYDLDAAADELGFSDRPSGRGKTTRRAEQAVQNLRESRTEVENREREQRRLRDLNRELEEAERARDRLEYLEQLEDWHEARETLRKERTRLQEYPDFLENFTGDELERLEELDREIETVQQEQLDVNHTIEEARARLGELEVPDGENASGAVLELKDDHEKLKDYESEIDAFESRLEKFLSRRAEAAKALGANDGLEALDRASFDELGELARREEETRSRLEVLETYRDLLRQEEGEENFDWDYETLRRGCERLETWLAHPDGFSDGRTGSPGLPLVTSSIVIAALSVVTGAYLHPYFYGLLVLPVIIHFWSRHRGTVPGESLTSDEASVRQAARRQYERLDLPSEPDPWSREGVREQLEELYSKRALQRLRETRSSEWERRKEEYEQLRSERKQLNEERNRYATKYGFSVEDSRLLLHFVNRLSRWQDAHEEVKSIENQIDRYGTLRDELLDEINEELDRWHLESVEDASELRSRVRTMEERVDEYRDTRRALDRATEKSEELQGRLPELREEREQFFDDLGLESNEEFHLRESVEEFEDYRRQKKSVEDARAVLEARYDRLTDQANYKPSHEEWERGRIDRAIDEARATAQKCENIREEITRIQTEIEEAKKGYEIEPARAEKERALGALHEQFLDDCAALIGNDLRRYLESAHSKRTAPAVFERARERLSTITAGRYRLEVTPSSKDPGFRVIDSRTGVGKGLDELSSGTRIQVLLAVRLAFVENNEQRLQFPLYLDETLANADDTRAQTIIESIGELAQAGRQIFYLTAQGDEVAKWQAHARDLHTIDLIEETGGSSGGSVDVPDPQTLSGRKNSVPSGEGVGHEEYGEKLGVPPFNPREPVESVHLWYLVENVERLEELLSRNLEQWGPLKTLLNVSDRDPLGARDGAPERIRQLAGAAKTFIHRWRHGRNRPMDRSVLLETAAVSENFLDEVAELVEDCDGDPQLVLERLRDGAVSGFRTNKMDELEQFLLQNDYLDPRDPLEDSVIRAAMISSLDASFFETPDRIIDRLLERIRDRQAE
jgi:DNA repair exonuclease SbcCD ATPase subunit